MEQVNRSPQMRAMFRRAMSRELERSCDRERTAKVRRLVLSDSELESARNVGEEIRACGGYVRKRSSNGRERRVRYQCRSPLCMQCRRITQKKVKEQADDFLSLLPKDDIWALTLNLEAVPFDITTGQVRKLIKKYRQKLYNGLRREFGDADLLLLGFFELAALKSSQCDPHMYLVARDVDRASDDPAFLLHLHAWVYVGETGKENFEKKLKDMFPARNSKRVRLEQRFDNLYKRKRPADGLEVTFVKSVSGHIKDWAGYSAKVSLKVRGFGDRNAEVLARLVDLLEGVRGRGLQGLRYSYNKRRFNQMRENRTGPYARKSRSDDPRSPQIVAVEDYEPISSKLTGYQEKARRFRDFLRKMRGFRDPRYFERQAVPKGRSNGRKIAAKEATDLLE